MKVSMLNQLDMCTMKNHFGAANHWQVFKKLVISNVEMADNYKVGKILQALLMNVI